MIGIVGYGSYIPKYRLKLSEIAQMWGKTPGEIETGLRIAEKAVPSIDEDSITMGVEAGKRALEMASIPASDLQSVYFGSESHPYVVNPSSTTLGEYLGIGNNYFAADLEFACKAATAGIQITVGFLDSNKIKYGLVCGSDVAQGRPHDALEYTAASAACTYILGNKNKEVIAKVLHMSSFSSDTPDFWRREGARYPSHFGRFTGEPAYFTHVLSEGKKLLKESRMDPSDFSYCVFHMPNGKFPRVAARKLGFTPQQLAPSLTVDRIGNPYSASSLLGLAAVLDIALPAQKIFFVSYGSGAGSDGFVFEVTENIVQKRKKAIPVAKQMEDKVYISYAEYLRKTHTI
ncbi:MAG: hydroxymethylglutaryl-CoA synthase [Candidatus Levybacteria bacterium]|nr:hydroxymethylglutaryl-CoA synthase [Candidatus Levybacteria bacterium]MDZ4228610.1 hydroxymethylglutaryl-CoA synthase [Candidatus Levybacteria bacterium]